MNSMKCVRCPAQFHEMWQTARFPITNIERLWKIVRWKTAFFDAICSGLSFKSGYETCQCEKWSIFAVDFGTFIFTHTRWSLVSLLNRTQVLAYVNHKCVSNDDAAATHKKARKEWTHGFSESRKWTFPQLQYVKFLFFQVSTLLDFSRFLGWCSLFFWITSNLVVWNN